VCYAERRLGIFWLPAMFNVSEWNVQKQWLLGPAGQHLHPVFYVFQWANGFWWLQRVARHSLLIHA